MPSPIDAICNTELGSKTPACQAKDVVGGAADAVQSTIEFGQDPFGYIAGALQSGANGLAGQVIPALSEVTRPQLTGEWFIDAYRVSFGLAVIVWLFISLWQFFQLGRRQATGDDVMASLSFYTPVFFLGASFGPVVGAAMTGVFGELADWMVAWGITDSVDTTVVQLQASIEAGDPAGMAGGAVVAIVIYLVMILALLAALLLMLVQLVALYFSGILFPLGWAWITHPKRRALGSKIPIVWFGILASHPLMFFLLAIAFSLSANLGTSFSDSGLQILANLFVASVALLLAATSPLLLMKFAPVLPTGTGPVSSPSLTGGGGGHPESSEDSQLAQEARKRGDGGTRSDGPASDSDAEAPGPLESRLGLGAAGGASQGQPAPSFSPLTSPVGEPSGGGAGGAGAASAGAPAPGGALTGAGGTGAAGGGAQGAAASAAEGGGAAVEAGTAASATGVGAVVGVPLAVAGAAMSATAAAAEKTAEVVQEQAPGALDAMDFDAREDR